MLPCHARQGNACVGATAPASKRERHSDGLARVLLASTAAGKCFFDASGDDGSDRGPPPLFTKKHPNGVPEELLDPRYHQEALRTAKLLLATANWPRDMGTQPVRR